MAPQDEVSKVPLLVAPREQSVVPGDRVSFLWKPTKNARSYRLQVAGEPGFDEVVFDSGALNRTEFVLRDGLPTDEDTFYWRVLVEDADGVVHGEDNIESFVSATAASAGRDIEQPDQDENLGPVEQLFRGAAAQAAAEVSDAPRWVQEEDELGVEHEGIEAGQILGFILAVAVALGLAIFTLFQYADLTAKAALAEATGRSGYPELRQHQLRALELLTQYDVVDPQLERYRIPIDRAMQLMANDEREGSAISPELQLPGDN